jgi:hypothetical protein
MASLPSAPASLSKAHATALAQAHVTYLNAHHPPPGTQQWVVSDPVEYDLYWYFDYDTDLPTDQALDFANVFAYQPGYLIWKQTQACGLVAELLSLARLRPQLRLPLAELVQVTQVLHALAEPPAQADLLFTYLHQQALAEACLPALPFLGLDPPANLRS